MISVFDVFKIGIGPSSSHTVGPMKAANMFVDRLIDEGLLDDIDRIICHLYGSLAHTGLGHGTDKAIVWGIHGERPETIDVQEKNTLFDSLSETGCLSIRGIIEINYSLKRDLKFHRKGMLPLHSNGIVFDAKKDGNTLFTCDYYSIGGGFIHDPLVVESGNSESGSIPHPFKSAKELLEICEKSGKSIATISFENECANRTIVEIEEGILNLSNTMFQAIEAGCGNEGILPGELNVRRRAPELFKKLSNDSSNDPLIAMDWVNLFALAVNEENAAGGRVVTAPTNGAAGIIPAVLAYYNKFVRPLELRFLQEFFLTAAAIGALYKMNASISGAEVGCQGEVGVACSMAASGLTAVMGGSPKMVENAAEIGMEHNLGLTCDPIGGLVQVPCIERNAMGATKAINAARLALRGTGDHKVSLDKVIQTMRQTGKDMKSKYKETSKGGLAVNIVEC